MKWKPITGLEFSALGAVKYSATSQEHLITDDSNQAMAYRAMPDATVRDRNPSCILIRITHMHYLLAYCLKEVFINVRTIRCWDMTSALLEVGIMYLPKNIL